jgi:filamentous hemagglutinin family protein
MQSHRKHYLWLRHLIFGLCLFLVIPYTVSLAQEVPPITSSGLHTTVSAPLTLPSGQTQFDITGGTRPGGGGNLFHSFGDFNVPNNHIANLLNDSGLATSNILGRVTGGHVSNIFGTIQTTGFGNANLFLMNPTGFLFGDVHFGGLSPTRRQCAVQCHSPRSTRPTLECGPRRGLWLFGHQSRSDYRPG